ncbi:CGNR zinc finger domain-containing protein [Catenulispora rubra]|uniref:CGNR zinc finger domain-containing protein n=1 Tax=Catenulispora rubra TaxID=280293 RepID=UPI001892603A|nr:CGNR zinc finger domain-containing protein [Catenulispora rubra]
MVSSGTPKPAVQDPAAAAALVDVLNSRPHATPLLPDTLEDPATSGDLLRPFGQPEGESPSPERIAQLKVLRSDLMALVADPESKDGEQAWARLTEHASDVDLRQSFTPTGQVQLRQVGGDPVVGAVILAVAQLVTDGTWSRIRACANTLCSHVFYDPTRSRTQRWDSYETCGNRTNVAAHRARARSRASAT